jgi:hypothetical protein
VTAVTHDAKINYESKRAALTADNGQAHVNTDKE